MVRFAYGRASTVEDALQAVGEGCHPLAGGTDLVGLMKRRLTKPERLVNLKTVPGLRGIERREGGWQIGALTTLGELEELAARPGEKELTILSEAAAASASPQLRHMATIGGNLLQRPRCWYFRDPLSRCWLKGGDGCLAAGGKNAYHAILGPGRCRMVHASDPAVALLALDARVEVAGREGRQEIDLVDFFAEPRPGARSETVLKVDELVTNIWVPMPPSQAHGAFVKVAERRAWDFALVSAAAQLLLDGERVEQACVVLGGVASRPWRAREVDGRLVGRRLTSGTIRDAASASTAGAKPLADNGYKVRLMESAVRQALRRVSQAAGVGGG
jgi:xanthine dehydrogenase YagS FAD-binding subunit